MKNLKIIRTNVSFQTSADGILSDADSTRSSFQKTSLDGNFDRQGPSEMSDPDNGCTISHLSGNSRLWEIRPRQKQDIGNIDLSENAPRKS
jgi:hypothetical protein